MNLALWFIMHIENTQIWSLFYFLSQKQTSNTNLQKGQSLINISIKSSKMAFEIYSKGHTVKAKDNDTGTQSIVETLQLWVALLIWR